MSNIDDRINSMKIHLIDTYSVIQSKGGVLPTNKNLANLANAIDSIQATITDAPQLNAVNISLGTLSESNDPLTITDVSNNGNFVASYDIYENSSLVANVARTGSSTTVNLRTYFSTAGTYTVTVKAKRTGMEDSNASRSVSYQFKPKLAAPTITFDGNNTITVSAVANATGYAVYANGYFKGTSNSTIIDLTTLPFTTTDTYSITIIAVASGYYDSNDSNAVSCYIEATSNIDAILDNNSWAVIKEVCEAGNAASYWAVGDEKTDTGTDGTIRKYRIADMNGLYNKHVVFEQLTLELSMLYAWNVSSNLDEQGYQNNYSISTMRTTALPETLGKYSLELQVAITDTTFIAAKNGRSSATLQITDKIFLPAMKEISSSSSTLCVESNYLITYYYYQTHTNDSDHIKYKADSTAGVWWTRSPTYSNSSAGYVPQSGSINNYSYSYVGSSYSFAPCFAF